MVQDLRYALRTLRKSPAFTIVVIVTLALGIGANAAIFSIISSLLLRPLPVSDPDRLALLAATTSASYRPPFSFAVLEQLERHAHAFDGALAFSGCCGRAKFEAGNARYDVRRLLVSGDFFDTLGVRAFRGRLLSRTDNDVAPPDGFVGVISYAFWRRLGAPESGTIHITLDDLPFTIVGVAPPGFFGVEVGLGFDVAVPLRVNAALSRMPLTDNTANLQVVMRLKPAVTMQAAVADLRAIQPQIRTLAMPQQGDQQFLTEPFTLEPIRTGTSALRERFARPLLVIFVVVMLVLLVACANIGNLFLARAIGRRREFAVRSALGATRWRLVRHLLVEAGLVSAGGALLGILCAGWTSRLLVTTLSTGRTPVVLDTTLDWRVVLLTAVITTAVAAIFGMMPAVRTTRGSHIGEMSARGTGAVSGLSDGLMVLQAAFAVLLVVAASLFVQTFVKLARVPTGFDSNKVVVATIGVSRIPFASRLAVDDKMLNAVRGTSGIAAAGAAFNPPFVGNMEGDLVFSRPGTQAPSNAERVSQLNTISPGWLAAYGIPLQAGRDFDDRDTFQSPRVMIVNEAFVEHLVPSRVAIGATLAMTLRYPPMGETPMGVFSIVGVVGNTVFRSLRQAAKPAVYMSMAQFGPTTPYTTLFITARSVARDPALVERPIAAAIARVNDNVAVSFETLSEEMDDSMAEERLTAGLSGLLGILALMLAAVGVYGVTAYTAGQRRREIGIRVALGATTWDITSVVVRRAAWLSVIGAGCGLVLAYAATQAVRALMYGVDAHDPTSFAGAGLALIGVALVGSYVPAIRAARVDPSVVLHVE